MLRVSYAAAFKIGFRFGFGIPRGGMLPMKAID